MSPPAFTAADAEWLREHQPAFTSRVAKDFSAAPPPLSRYLQHYQFDRVLVDVPSISHHLGFANWRGFSTAHHRWTRANATATVVIAHGLFDHTALYLRLIKHLLTQGFDVVAFDLPGHGLSGGERANIQSFRQYSAVLAACIETCDNGRPIYAIAQSTGGSALLDLFLRDGEGERHTRIERVVLLAPLVRAYAWNGIKVSHWLLSRLIKALPRHFGPNSHDKDFLYFLSHKDPLQPVQICTAWVSAMRRWEKRFRTAPALPLRGLIIQGTQDKTVDWRWNVPHIQAKFPELRVHYVPGGMHHLIGEGEQWRDDVYDALTRYLKGIEDSAKYNSEPQ